MKDYDYSPALKASKIVWDVARLQQWLTNGEAVLVDVREPAEYAAEHIAGATLLPLSKVSAAALPPHDGKKLVLHCLKGGRGGSACEKLLAEAPALELYHLQGGMGAWNAAKLPVVCSGKTMLPLDRQVQLTVGLGLLAASALAWWVNPAFVALTGFFGAGLTFAGLTGFCGLARILAKMPWNQCKKSA